MKKIFMILVLLVSFIGSVSANQFVLTEKIEGEYVQINRINTKFNMYFYGVVDMTTNEYIYCIQPGISLSDQSYEDVLDHYEKVGLTKDQFETISKIAYFGYGYTGRMELKWYLATQMLIWEELIESPHQIYFTNSIGGARIEKYEIEKTMILRDINKATIIPEFEADKFVVSIGETLKISDSNLVLQDFLIETELDFEANQFDLSFFAKTAGVYRVNFSRIWEGNRKPIAYYHETGQNLLRTGTLASLEKEIVIEVLAGKVKIQKIDADTLEPLSDTIFLLKDENGKVIFEGETDNMGAVIVENLFFGTYYLYEVLSKEGYYNDNYYREIVINEDNLYEEITVKNRKITMIPDTLKND